MPGAHFCAEWFLEISIPPQLKKFGTQLGHMTAVGSLPVTVGRVDTDEQTGCPLLPCQIMTKVESAPDLAFSMASLISRSASADTAAMA